MRSIRRIRMCSGCRRVRSDCSTNSPVENPREWILSYVVHELFLTAQGEGANIGRVAVFIRFAGCNLWSGREADRAKSVCRFCDTEFVGGKRFASARALADKAAATWRG